MRRSLFVACTLLLLSASAHAAPKYRDVLAEGKKLSKSESHFAKSVAKLSATKQERLRNALSTVGSDSDGDGESDIYEHAFGSNVCTPDRNGDGSPDGEDLEVKGTIDSYVAPTLAIGTHSLTVSGATIFKGRRDAPFSESDLQTGVCVEVKGHLEGATEVADFIKSSNDCGDGED